MTPWNLRDASDEQAQCIRCRRTRDATDVDRQFWCRECRARAAERAKARGWAAGAVAAAIFALWIFLFVRPTSLTFGGWIAAVLAAFWLIARISREIHYGAARYRNRAGVEEEAYPPVEDAG